MSDVIFRNPAGEQRAFEVEREAQEPALAAPPQAGWFPVRMAIDHGNGNSYPISLANTFEDDEGMRWTELSRLPPEFPGDWRLAGVIATRAERDRIELLLVERTREGSACLGHGYFFADNENTPMHYGVWLDARVWNPADRRDAIWRDFRQAVTTEFPEQHYGTYIAVN